MDSHDAAGTEDAGNEDDYVGEEHGKGRGEGQPAQGVTICTGNRCYRSGAARH